MQLIKIKLGAEAMLESIVEQVPHVKFLEMVSRALKADGNDQASAMIDALITKYKLQIGIE